MKETGRSLFPWGKKIEGLNELYRTYVWSGGDSLTIPRPQMLVVSDNGHRVLDENGVSYYVPYGWLYVNWKVIKESPHFYFERERNK